jgi:hypothetical protein
MHSCVLVLTDSVMFRVVEACLVSRGQNSDSRNVNTADYLSINVVRFRYEGCPERIRPFLISRERVSWP